MEKYRSTKQRELINHSERMVFPLWRSLHALNLMLPKEDRRALLLRLFNKDVQPINTIGKPDQASSELVDEAISAGGDADNTASNANEDTDDGGVKLNEHVPSYVDVEKDFPSPAARSEEDFIQADGTPKREEEGVAITDKQAYLKDGGEEDRLNTSA